jgi:hypothetical protein
MVVMPLIVWNRATAREGARAGQTRSMRRIWAMAWPPCSSPPTAANTHAQMRTDAGIAVPSAHPEEGDECKSCAGRGGGCALGPSRSTMAPPEPGRQREGDLARSVKVQDGGGSEAELLLLDEEDQCSKGGEGAEVAGDVECGPAVARVSEETATGAIDVRLRAGVFSAPGASVAPRGNQAEDRRGDRRTCDAEPDHAQELPCPRILTEIDAENRDGGEAGKARREHVRARGTCPGARWGSRCESRGTRKRRRRCAGVRSQGPARRAWEPTIPGRQANRRRRSGQGCRAAEGGGRSMPIGVSVYTRCAQPTAPWRVVSGPPGHRRRSGRSARRGWLRGTWQREARTGPNTETAAATLKS